MDLKRCSMHTQAVHAGERPARPDFTPVSAPIYPSVGYVYDDMEDLDGVFAGARAGFVYPRYGSPTVAALEAAVATLEGGEGAVATASGMAAIHLALLAAGVRPGDHVLAAQDVYGATYALLANLCRSQGIATSFVDATDLMATQEAVEATRPRAVVVETLSNPLLKVADLPALAALAHGVGAALIVDSSLTSPYLVQPLAWGADYAVHSATKYLGGHGDVMGGVVVAGAERCAEMRELIKLTGGNLGPMEAWLVLRGLKTLPLRMRQHSANALEVAQWLAGRGEVAHVNYPGLATHPQHDVARRLFRPGLYGGMVSFELAGAGREQVFRFMEALQLCLPATTLGDVYSLVLYPAMSSHRALPAEERARIGIGDGLVRLSVGIEEAADIVADLERALDAARDA
ncbi:MAG TPA: PLP-dependent aspartate aminotransferase family protein [Anaerolineae bacterium]|nr:PLP-dependent aspartate aminotransferase family protein [Anaerolineae bacterium]HOQ98853.1 PLP-dependent aspartate aminotransferase family protein [Anaerolineae bacterium]HPL27077.1 PLP-dependent aspartate aminotransferase family protein [Anaerolineae bacterium]